MMVAVLLLRRRIGLWRLLLLPCTGSKHFLTNQGSVIEWVALEQSARLLSIVADIVLVIVLGQAF